MAILFKIACIIFVVLLALICFAMCCAIIFMCADFIHDMIKTRKE